ncbi:MAG: hypothetical protein ACC631_03020 [Halocynthiibacter sp.]
MPITAFLIFRTGDGPASYLMIATFGFLFALILAVLTTAAFDGAVRLIHFARQSQGPLVLAVYASAIVGTYIHQLFFNGFVYSGWNWYFHLGYSFLISRIWPLYWGWRGLFWLAN